MGRLSGSVGFRAGEPFGLSVQLYHGTTAGNRKSKGLIDLVIGREGAIMNLGPHYAPGEWRPGGWRYSAAYFRQVSPRITKDYLYVGLGLQGGSHNYYRLGKIHKEPFGWGPIGVLHGEIPLGVITLTPQYLYCKATVFLEGIFYTEVKSDFNYLRPAAGLRLNFFH